MHRRAIITQMALTLRRVVAAAAMVMILLAAGKPQSTVAAALPACQQLDVALSTRLMGSIVQAGKPLKVTARVRNNGLSPVSRVGVKITLPSSWNVTASTVAPAAGLARKRAIVIGGNTAYWTNMPLGAGKARRFALRVAVPACPAFATGLGIDIAAYIGVGGGAGATCLTNGRTAQVRRLNLDHIHQAGGFLFLLT
jgi:hypothetical protein